MVDSGLMAWGREGEWEWEFRWELFPLVALLGDIVVETGVYDGLGRGGSELVWGAVGWRWV